MRVAGIMSGTSLDGIDVAIVDIKGRSTIRVVAFETTPYAAPVREALLAVSNTVCHTRDIARLHFLLPELYAEAARRLCRRSRVPLRSIELIGCHGQTIFHEGEAARYLGRPVASTLQIGNGSVLARRLGVPVVCDFRPADMAAGGKGAPLVPFLDYLLFRHPNRTRVALNLGGIANISVIPRAARPSDVIAFDTGPGNMVMDSLVCHFTGGRRTFDKNGDIAARGHVHLDIVHRLMKNPYYHRKPPKTAGREQYGPDFLEPFLAMPFADAVATATAFTAATVVHGIRLAGARPDDLIVGGGGVRNRQLMAMLAAQLPSARVMVTDDFGIDADAKEAVAFAVMARATWRGRPSNISSATGGKPAVLGTICLL